jgi:hypothetical protein
MTPAALGAPQARAHAERLLAGRVAPAFALAGRGLSLRLATRRVLRVHLSGLWLWPGTEELNPKPKTACPSLATLKCAVTELATEGPWRDQHRDARGGRITNPRRADRNGRVLLRTRVLHASHAGWH